VIHDILVTHDGHTTSGIIGIKCMLEALSRLGRTDVVLRMLIEVDTYPSYGYMLKGGALGAEPATTLWELWDGDQEGPSMNSRNHIMFGTVSSWMHKHLLGVTPAAPGYAAVRIAPAGISECALLKGGSCNLTSASGQIETPRGPVSVEWSVSAAGSTCSRVREGGDAELRCALPGDAISYVDFASFGTPTGACAADGSGGFVRSGCDSNASVANVTAACLGKARCSVPASSAFFGGDPCYGATKALAVAVRCSKPTTGLALSLNVSVPAKSTVVVPVLDPASSTVTEGGVPLWQAGGLVPGVAGVVAAKAVAAPWPAVEVQVLSGEYAFVSIALP